LRRLAPNLRREGIEVVFGRHTKKGTPITLERTEKTLSPPSPSSPVPTVRPLEDDDFNDTPSARPSPQTFYPGGSDDGGDGSDGLLNGQSGSSNSDEVRQILFPLACG
jgi:hypothetical protein